MVTRESVHERKQHRLAELAMDYLAADPNRGDVAARIYVIVVAVGTTGKCLPRSTGKTQWRLRRDALPCCLTVRRLATE